MFAIEKEKLTQKYFYTISSENKNNFLEVGSKVFNVTEFVCFLLYAENNYWVIFHGVTDNYGKECSDKLYNALTSSFPEFTISKLVASEVVPGFSKRALRSWSGIRKFFSKFKKKSPKLVDSGAIRDIIQGF